MPPLSSRLRWALVALLAAGAPAIGCDEADFDPFEPSNRYFSVYGYLDAAADTQFVRVTPLRDSLLAGPGPLDAAVTLERLDTGAKTVWRDSLVRLAGGRLGHVFWSAERVVPGPTYRLAVTRSDGAASVADVVVPDTIREVILSSGGGPGVPPTSQSITVSGAEHLADLRLHLQLSGPSVGVTLAYLPRASRTPDGLYIVGADVYADTQQALNGGDGVCPGLQSARVFVAATTPGWPDFAGLDLETAALPDVNTNVEHGLGFVGGVAIKEVAWPGLVGDFAVRQDLCRRNGG